MNTKSLRVNICSLSSQVSNRDNPYFKLVAQDLGNGGMYTFFLMKDFQNTQKVLDSLFKCSVSQTKLFNALRKPENVITLNSRFLRNPYEFTLVGDDNIPPVFELAKISEIELVGEKLLKKAFTLNKRV